MPTQPLYTLNCTRRMQRVGIGSQSRSRPTCPNGRVFSTVFNERLPETVDDLRSCELERLVVILEELLQPLISKRVMEQLIENLERHGGYVRTCFGGIDDV